MQCGAASEPTDAAGAGGAAAAPQQGRPNQRWTAAEEAALRAGIQKHGFSKWQAIISDPDPAIGPPLAARTNVDLKDKWRNIRPKDQKTGGTNKRRRPSGPPTVDDSSLLLGPSPCADPRDHPSPTEAAGPDSTSGAASAASSPQLRPLGVTIASSLPPLSPGAHAAQQLGSPAAWHRHASLPLGGWSAAAAVAAGLAAISSGGSGCGPESPAWLWHHDPAAEPSGGLLGSPAAAGVISTSGADSPLGVAALSLSASGASQEQRRQLQQLQLQLLLQQHQRGQQDNNAAGALLAAGAAAPLPGWPHTKASPGLPAASNTVRAVSTREASSTGPSAFRPLAAATATAEEAANWPSGFRPAPPWLPGGSSTAAAAQHLALDLAPPLARARSEPMPSWPWRGGGGSGGAGAAASALQPAAATLPSHGSPLAVLGGGGGIGGGNDGCMHQRSGSMPSQRPAPSLYDACAALDMPGVVAALSCQGHTAVGSRGAGGATALHALAAGLQSEAAEGRGGAIADALLQAGLQVDVLDAAGATPLHCAASAAAARVLLARGANASAVNNAGETPIFSAAERGALGVLQSLLAAGVAVDHAGECGETALTRAASRPELLPAALALLEAGASAAVVDAAGRTPLHAAAEAGCKTLVAALLASGANAGVADADGDTPRALALRGGHAAAASLLRAAAEKQTGPRQDDR